MISQNHITQLDPKCCFGSNKIQSQETYAYHSHCTCKFEKDTNSKF